jgi:hypothetical protein
MVLREAYPHRAGAALAHGALEDAHMEHPAALGPGGGGGSLGERGGGVAPEDQARQPLCTCTVVPGVVESTYVP